MNSKKIAFITLTAALSLGLSACDRPDGNDDEGNMRDQTYNNSNNDSNMGDQGNDADAAITDATITTKVKTDLLTEAGLKSSDITVNTVDGVVTLTGTTDTQNNSDKAKKIAGNVSGVKNVLNQVTVKP